MGKGPEQDKQPPSRRNRRANERENKKGHRRQSQKPMTFSRGQFLDLVVPGWAAAKQIGKTRSWNPLDWDPAVTAWTAMQVSAIGVGTGLYVAESSKKKADPELIKDHYPELLSLPLSASGTFVTADNTEVNWFNYTDTHFDPQQMNRAISYFQKLMPPEGSIINIKQDGQMIPVQLIPRKATSEYPLFIIPQDAPTTSWTPAQNAYTTNLNPDAGTHVNNGVALATFVRLQENPKESVFTTAAQNTNKMLAIEACQIGIETGSLTADLAVIAQERFCNSIGTTVAAKAIGMNHADYMDLAARRRIGGYEMLFYFEPEYNAIPPLSAILTQ
jgi:hypothetical protein